MPVNSKERKQGFFSREQQASYIYLLKWSLLALLAGCIGSALVRIFRICLLSGRTLLDSAVLPRPVWAVIGALLTGGIIYRISPDAAGEGIPSYLYSLNHQQGSFSIKVTVMKLISGFLTLVSFGNGGVVGPLGRVSAGLLSRGADLFTGRHLNDQDRRTAAVCGLSSVIGAVFHTPVGGGIFAVEIIQRSRLGYRDLFPSILASIIAVWLSRLLGWEAFYAIDVPSGDISSKIIAISIVLSLLVGIAGGFFTWLYSFTVRIFRRDKGRVLIKVLGGTVIAAGLAWPLNPALMGTSPELFTALIRNDLFLLRGNLSGAVPVTLICIIMFFAKMTFNCLTVGSGMSAGFTGPSVLLGMLLAFAAATALRIPFGGPEFYALLAAGFSGILAAAMNVPLAAAVMTIEIFGLSYSIPAGLAAIIGFQVNRYQTLYDYAMAGSGKQAR